MIKSLSTTLSTVDTAHGSGVTAPFPQSTLVNGQGVVCPLTVVNGTRTRVQWWIIVIGVICFYLTSYQNSIKFIPSNKIKKLNK